MRDASTQVDGVSRRRSLGFGTETQTRKDPVEEEEDGYGSRWSYPLRWKKDGVELGGGGEGFGCLGSAEVDEVNTSAVSAEGDGARRCSKDVFLSYAFIARLRNKCGRAIKGASQDFVSLRSFPPYPYLGGTRFSRSKFDHQFDQENICCMLQNYTV